MKASNAQKFDRMETNHDGRSDLIGEIIDDSNANDPIPMLLERIENLEWAVRTLQANP